MDLKEEGDLVMVKDVVVEVVKVVEREEKGFPIKIGKKGGLDERKDQTRRELVPKTRRELLVPSLGDKESGKIILGKGFEEGLNS